MIAGYGYARVLTTDQDLAIRRAALREAGCTIIRAEQASGSTREGRRELANLTIHQDVDLYTTLRAPGDEVSHEIAAGRGGWVRVAPGFVSLNGEAMEEGDGVAIATSGSLRIKAAADAEVLLFDMCPDLRRDAEPCRIWIFNLSYGDRKCPSTSKS